MSSTFWSLEQCGISQNDLSDGRNIIISGIVADDIDKDIQFTKSQRVILTDFGDARPLRHHKRGEDYPTILVKYQTSRSLELLELLMDRDTLLKWIDEQKETKKVDVKWKETNRGQIDLNTLLLITIGFLTYSYPITNPSVHTSIRTPLSPALVHSYIDEFLYRDC